MRRARRQLSQICSARASAMRTLLDAEKFCDAVPAGQRAGGFRRAVDSADGDRLRSVSRAARSRSSAGRCSPRSPPRSRCRPSCGRCEVDGRVLVDGGATNPLPFDRAARPGRHRSSRSIFPAAPAERGRTSRSAGNACTPPCSVMSHSIIDGEAQARRARPAAAAQCRHLPHARFLPGERDPARRRARQGRVEGEAWRAAAL